MCGLLNGKICLVTGTGRGIGKSIAEHFIREGATVYANARKIGSIDEWAEKISTNSYGKVIPVYYDVTDTRAVQKAFTDIYHDRHRLDVLVNNAGISQNELIGMIREETIHSLFETNVFACIQHMQYAARIMKRQKCGSIITISSIIGIEGGYGELVYAGTKGAVISMTKSAAKELAPDHIRVNSVAPGMTETDMFFASANTKEKVEVQVKNIGFGKLASPDDIAEACVYFAGDRSSFITGQILRVDGGAGYKQAPL